MRPEHPILDILEILLRKDAPLRDIGSGWVDQEVQPIRIHNQQFLLLRELKQYYPLLQLKPNHPQQIPLTVEEQHTAIVLLRQFELLRVVLPVEQSERAAVGCCGGVEIFDR